MTGSNLHPFAAYQLHRGLQTLPIRIRTQQASTEELARRLFKHNAVESVSYATAENSALVGAGKQMASGGTVLGTYATSMRPMRPPCSAPIVTSYVIPLHHTLCCRRCSAIFF
jgi:hypothetical protein